MSFHVLLVGFSARNATHELAVVTALVMFQLEAFKHDLRQAQMMARMTVLEWFQEGKVATFFLQSFEDELYQLYKPI